MSDRLTLDLASGLNFDAGRAAHGRLRQPLPALLVGEHSARPAVPDRRHRRIGAAHHRAHVAPGASARSRPTTTKTPTGDRRPTSDDATGRPTGAGSGGAAQRRAFAIRRRPTTRCATSRSRSRPASSLPIVGPNGSGKSTLARVLAGRRPTSGEVVRPGIDRPRQARRNRDRVPAPRAPGARRTRAGRRRVGTARTAAASTWRPCSTAWDCSAFAERETSTLSGGELQRLAVAAALARRPALLISDESTAMVDSVGACSSSSRCCGRWRPTIASRSCTSRTIPRRRPSPIGRSRSSTAVSFPQRSKPRVDSDAASGAGAAQRKGGPLFVLRSVGHEYSRRTPWAHRALSGIDLRIDHGEAVLVVGHNGSGKSTLAWVLAGLLHPSEGDARIEGEPITSVVGQVGRRVSTRTVAAPAADRRRRSLPPPRARRTSPPGRRCARSGSIRRISARAASTS